MEPVRLEVKATYRLTAATLGLVSEDERLVPVMIPCNATVIVEHGNPNDNRMVDVTWGEKTVSIFVQDLSLRGEPTSASQVEEPSKPNVPTPLPKPYLLEPFKKTPRLA